jgi:Nickel responsive protein SCO4226-like
MPKYLIERDIPRMGHMSPEALQAASRKSVCVLENLGPRIQWQHSYVTGDQLYCVYIAPDEEMIRAHANESGFPATRISEIKTTIDPTTAE